MGREIEHKESTEAADRSAIHRALERASRNTTRPSDRNRKIVEHLKALTILYADDLSDRANGGSGKRARVTT